MILMTVQLTSEFHEFPLLVTGSQNPGTRQFENEFIFAPIESEIGFLWEGKLVRHF